MDSSRTMSPSPIGRRGIRDRLLATLRPGWIAGIYAGIATVWIYFSDQMLAALVPDPERLLAWSVYKGLGFVAVTSLLLFVLIRASFNQIRRGYVALEARDREREIHVAEIERLGRLYAALSQVAQAIPRTGNQTELFETVCRILVEYGGLRTAWIGWREGEEGVLAPVAGWEQEGGGARVLAQVSDEAGKKGNPTDVAVRSGEPNILNHLRSGPQASTWEERALARGEGSCAAFPIRVEGAVRGALSVASPQSNFFQAQEVALLSSAVSDLALALERMARETARRRAQAVAEQERLFSETMIESMPGILYLYSEEGRFLRWNQNFERVSGYPAEELTQISPLEFFDTDAQPELAQRIAEVFESGESFVEAPFLSKDGTATPYYLTGRRVRFEDQECLVGVGIDVSQRHAAEAALRELNQTLELKVSERTAELRHALVRAEAADRLKSAFLATMSHELRTPLNSIIGFTGIILQGLAGPLTEEQGKQLGMVRGSARHLLDLINDVLDLSKIEAGQLEVRREPFDLAASIAQVVEIVRPLAEAKGLALSACIDSDVGEIVGDRRRVEQILLNLLQNGLKFTDAGQVELHAERVGGQVRLRVRDSGIGIREEDLASLFQPFSQIDTGLTRQHEGTGLGLAICRRLTHLMGGEITAESEWGRGSTFQVSLPTTPTD
jgi:PAS domain S-box-containing protein